MDDPFAYQGRQGGAGTQPLSGQSKPLSETKSVPAHFPFPLAPQGRWGGVVAYQNVFNAAEFF